MGLGLGGLSLDLGRLEGGLGRLGMDMGLGGLDMVWARVRALAWGLFGLCNPSSFGD